MNKGKTSAMKRILMALNIVTLIGLAGFSAYLFIDNRDLNDQLTLTTEEKNKRLVDEINKVFDLPDEEPVVAVVTNPDEFKAEYVAFDNAEEGDYLLFYRKARLNVLYRQNEKRVVKTANVVVPIAVELIGSEAAISETEKKLADFGEQITITKKITDGITQSFVFDVDQDQGAELSSISEQLGIDEGTTLPSGFTPESTTEIVVVVVESKSSAEPATLVPETE